MEVFQGYLVNLQQGTRAASSLDFLKTQGDTALMTITASEDNFSSVVLLVIPAEMEPLMVYTVE